MFWLKFGCYNGAVLQRKDVLRGIESRAKKLSLSGRGAGEADRARCTYTHCHVRIRYRAAGHSSALGLKNRIAVWKTVPFR
jgi:hypothetical protein